LNQDADFVAESPFTYLQDVIRPGPDWTNKSYTKKIIFSQAAHYAASLLSAISSPSVYQRTVSVFRQSKKLPKRFRTAVIRMVEADHKGKQAPPVLYDVKTIEKDIRKIAGRLLEVN
jgi:hypothetical protein